MAKRGRPGKNDPRYLARKAVELERLERQQQYERTLPKRSGCPEGVNKTNTGMFQARIRLNGNRINLGSFKTPEEAAAVYQNAKQSGFTCARQPAPQNMPSAAQVSLARDSNPYVCLHNLRCDRLSLGRSQGAEEEGAAAARKQRALFEHVRAARHERGRRLRRRAAARSSALQCASRRRSARPLADAGRARVAILRP